MGFRDDRDALEAKVRAQEAEIEQLHARFEQVTGAGPEAEMLEEENARLRAHIAQQQTRNEKDAWTGTLVLCLVVFPAVLILLAFGAILLTGE